MADIHEEVDTPVLKDRASIWVENDKATQIVPNSIVEDTVFISLSSIKMRLLSLTSLYPLSPNAHQVRMSICVCVYLCRFLTGAHVRLSLFV